MRDVIDLQWDVVRLRRLKAALLRANAHEGLREILAPFVEEDDIDELVDRWACGDPEAREEVSARLKPANLTVDEIMAATLGLNLDKVEQIDGLIKSAEARRNSAFREIDYHRQALGAAVRTTVQRVEDAEFKEVGGEHIEEAA